jgi:predicted TIM-barrel fold metal-dependent hydrolase
VNLIIDTHVHLGDVLFGKNITFQQGVVKRDHHCFLEKLENNDNIPYPEMLEADPIVLAESILNEEQARNNAGSLENLAKSLDRNTVDFAWALPIVPNISFEEILAASKLDPRIVPFTGIDFRLGEAAAEKLARDSENGAGGLKVHPILQRRAMDDPLVFHCLEAWKKTKKPVIFHTYRYEYFHPEQACMNAPDYGSNLNFLRVARHFPELIMIAAHSGGPFDFSEILSGKDMKNLYVDVSFQPADVIRAFIKEFGPERVLFGSDWPWGCQETPIRLIKQAADGDQTVEDLLLYKNALRVAKGEF